MSTRLVAVDVDPERGVMLHLDFTLLHRHIGLPCLPFLSLPFIEAHVRYDLILLSCTIRSGLVLVCNMIWLYSGVQYQSQSHAYYDT